MKAGDLIQERYLLEERLGKGGMGEVWRAHDERLKRTVAIKLIAPHLTDDPEFLARFLREAQSIAGISHPNVVGVLDFGETNEEPFLVMEYVAGPALTDLTGEPHEPEKAFSLMAQAAAGAGAAHAQGIVHRDIKPANILLTQDGRAKLVDFGIALPQGVERLTLTGAALGSPHYISPEQARGDKATARSDVYALGVVLYELLTGRRPFEGAGVAAVALAHVEQDPQPPSAHVPGLDAAVDDLVLKCLAKDPQHRFADGAQLQEALQGDPAGTQVLGSAGAGDTLLLGSSTGQTSTAAEPSPREGYGRSILVGAAVGLVLLAALVAVLLALRDEPDAIPQDGSTQEPRERQGGPGPADSPHPSPPEETEEPPPETIPPSPTEPETPPPTPTDEPTETEEEEGGLDVDLDDEPPGRGPDGEGPPGHEGK